MPPAPRTAIDVVIATLAPYVGENMARAAVNGQKEKLGLAADLPGDGLERLLAALEPGLGVFVGRERSKEISDAVRKAMAVRGQR